jgi:hypothetical protein
MAEENIDEASSPWTSWEGGSCPVPAQTIVIIILRKTDGGMAVWRKGAAQKFNWGRNASDPGEDIVAFKTA